MDRWREIALGPADEVRAICEQGVMPAPPAARQHQNLSDYNMQGLIGLPFVPAMPFINGHRTAQARSGAEALAELKPGQPVDGGASAFAKRHSGVRVFQGDAADYQVLAIDLGSVANNNVDNTDDVALAGVRAGRVEWVAPSLGYGRGVPALFQSWILCLDRDGDPGRVRRGCNGYGQYVP